MVTRYPKGLSVSLSSSMNLLYRGRSSGYMFSKSTLTPENPY